MKKATKGNKKGNKNLQWSEKDHKFLVDGQNDCSVTEMANMLGRTRRAVEMRLYNIRCGKNYQKFAKVKVSDNHLYYLMPRKGNPARTFETLSEMNSYLTRHPKNNQVPAKRLPVKTISVKAVVEEL